MRSLARPRILPLPVLLLANLATAQAGYDPMAIPIGKPTAVDLTCVDRQRNRELPIRVVLPSAVPTASRPTSMPASATSQPSSQASVSSRLAPAPVVLFSHGLGGSRAGYRYAAEHWAARGYVAVMLQHPGSDDAVWRDRPLKDRMSAMRAAANGTNLLLRAQDVTSVLDQLQQWNQSEGHPLQGRLDLERVGMSGHSFGALTTQAVSGQRLLGSDRLADPRIQAAVAMSPSSPRGGVDPGRAFSQVKMPWLLLTGTQDVSVIGDADLESRLSVFPALPPGDKYELVLAGAEHSAFSDGALPGDKNKRNPAHHQAILALTTAFWDAYLREDADAKSWLAGEGPKSILAKGDRWQKK